MKTFVLDTNVLLHNSECIESFADNNVVLPMAVIEELDTFKGHNDELGRNARMVIRRIDKLRVKGNLRDGVPLKGGGKLRILWDTSALKQTNLDVDRPDNRILALAYMLHTQGERVIFVSKDINARLKADALGLKAVDFEREKVNFDEFYCGYSEATVPREKIDEIQQKGVSGNHEGLGRYPNEFVILKDEADLKHTILVRVMEPGTLKFIPAKAPPVWNVQARNREQRMALELLMDPAVQLVTLVGQAGTGKTLLALAAALQCVVNDQKYDRILVSRPIIPMGKDIGYLPGDKDEKLSHWMQPIFDNLAYLLRDGSGDAATKKKGRSSVLDKIDQILSDKTIALEALTYIRGRSIPNQFVIIDEGQNLTPHEIKTIVSRAGEGTKMVLTGDPYQIDNPYLDASSNGLTYTAERLKGERLHGHVMLMTSERSTLAALAAEHL